MDLVLLEQKARDIRKKILEVIFVSKSSHIGSAFSIVDILTVLYFDVMNIDPKNPQKEDRDICVLSKGHASAALYTTLAIRGFFPADELEQYAQDGSSMAGHVIRNSVPGMEVTAGSLGHGLPITLGMALANKHTTRRFFCILGDGECNEGSVWEAALFAGHNKLGNVVAIIDNNKQQSMGPTKNVINNDDMIARWKSFGWDAIEVNGHNIDELQEVLHKLYNVSNDTKPHVIITNTIKGKGVSWMEDDIVWHYKNPTEEEFNDAFQELIV